MPTPSDAISLTSTPVWKSRPLPVCTITRTSGSRSSSSHASANSSRMALFMALRTSGRSLTASRPGRGARPGGVVGAHDSPLMVLLHRAGWPALRSLMIAGSPPRRFRARGRVRGGGPRTFSPMTFLLTSVVPPSMVLARLRIMPRQFVRHVVQAESPAQAWPCGPSRSVASSCMRWLSAPWWTLPIDAAGPGGASRPDRGPHPLVGPRPDAFLGVRAHEALAQAGVVGPTGRTGAVQQALDARSRRCGRRRRSRSPPPSVARRPAWRRPPASRRRARRRGGSRGRGPRPATPR